MWAAGSNGDAQLGLGPEFGIKNAEFRLVQRLKGERLGLGQGAAGVQHLTFCLKLRHCMRRVDLLTSRKRDGCGLTAKTAALRHTP